MSRDDYIELLKQVPRTDGDGLVQHTYELYLKHQDLEGADPERLAVLRRVYFAGAAGAWAIMRAALKNTITLVDIVHSVDRELAEFKRQMDGYDELSGS